MPQRAAPVASRQPAQQPKPQKKKSNGTAIAILAVVILLLLVLLVGSIVVSLKDTIYPGISIAGEELGGLTVSEAAALLEEQNYGSEAAEKELVVSLPTNDMFTISGEEAGLASDAREAAEMAYQYGREGNLLSNFFSYLGCKLKARELDPTSVPEVKEGTVRAKIEEAAERVNAALMENSMEIGEDSITLIKGAGTAMVDAEELYSLVVTALQSGDFSPISYSPALSDGEEMNFEALYDTVFTEPVNAEYDKELGAATQSVTGVSFDVAEAKRLWNEAQTGDTVVIPLIKTEPEISTEKLNSVLFADCLGQKSSSLGGSSASRVNNIKLAAQKINGIVLNPGEEFSYNGTLGQRTEAAGFQGAGAYSGGKVVTEIGGGICQVSSTLYYCALLANLEITERSCHYFAVSYLPSGLDATVSWPGPDFKFVNNRDYPIRIEAYTDMNSYTVVVKLWGTDVDGSYVELTTETWAMEKGTGAVSYRWVYDANGNLLSKKEEARSEYHFHEEEEEEEEVSPSPSETPEEESPAPSEEPDPTVPVTTEPPVVTEAPVATEPPAAEEPIAAEEPVE